MLASQSVFQPSGMEERVVLVATGPRDDEEAEMNQTLDARSLASLRLIASVTSHCYCA